MIFLSVLFKKKIGNAASAVTAVNGFIATFLLSCCTLKQVAH